MKKLYKHYSGGVYHIIFKDEKSILLENTATGKRVLSGADVFENNYTEIQKDYWINIFERPEYVSVDMYFRLIYYAGDLWETEQEAVDSGKKLDNYIKTIKVSI